MTAKDTDATASDSADEVEGRLTNPDMIRALGHPARLAISEHLAATRTAATATELASVVGLSPSATSYHLRAMARYGLVEEVERGGDGRERRWRGPERGWRLESEPNASGERRTAEEALVAAVLARANEHVTRWLARAGEEPAEWRDAAGVYNSTLLVTPAELAEINARLREVFGPYLRRNRPEPPEGARVVSAHLRMVPVQ